jgi:hypothetical protein
MPYVDRPLPETLELPRLCEPRPRYNGKANLRNGPGIGRVKGHQNKITRDLKEGLLEGAILHGYNGLGEDGLVGYCHYLAERHPKTYASLLARLLPFNMNANVATASIGEVRVISVPSGSHLTRAAIDALAHDSTLQSMPAEANLLEPTQVAEVEAPAVTPIVQETEVQTQEEAQLLAKLEALPIEEFAQLVSDLKHRLGVSLPEEANQLQPSAPKPVSEIVHPRPVARGYHPIPPARTQRPPSKPSWE